MSKKILIISYTFPPSNKIGGRRWVKFAKYFVKNNNDVRVITSKNKYMSGWLKDYDYLKTRITEISFNYPFYLGINPKNLGQKILYRLHLIWSKLNTSGNFYDKAIHAEKELIKKTRSFINKGYNNVIVTVAPFHLATHISKIISDYPQCNFIVDFRDPWINNRSAYGFHSLSKNRQLFEKFSEQKVIENFNCIITVSEYLSDELRLRYPKNAYKVHTINNGYDPEEIDLNIKPSHITSDLINIVLVGTLYDNAIKYFNHFNMLLEQLKESDSDIYDKLIVNIYGSFNMRNASNCIRFNGHIDSTKINNAIINSDACLLFLSDDINFSFNTKFCEYIARKKPILIFSNNGPTAQYILKNNLGVPLSLKTKVEEFSHIITEVINKKNINYDKFDDKHFQIPNLSNDILNLLNSLD